ncbi:MAG: Rrf2 family transcriptional regulator [Deltaproteobacteria bacterium]|nr:Rrf2 family transcriptional regulator [Deltaproteobacteria bacterium]
MFRLSKAADYSIRGILHLAMKPNGGPTDVGEIAKAQGVSTAYLAKLFQTLAKKGHIRSIRGFEGGFVLVKRPSEINLYEIIEAVEGPIFLNDCLIHSGFCVRDELCPVHDVWKDAQQRFLEHLKGTTFESLAKASKVKRARAAKRRQT